MIRAAVIAGTTAIRSHVDVDTIGGLKGLRGVAAARDDHADLCEIQLVAFPQEGIWRDPGDRRADGRGDDARAPTWSAACRTGRTGSTRRVATSSSASTSRAATTPTSTCTSTRPTTRTGARSRSSSRRPSERDWGPRTTAGHVCAMAAWEDDYAHSVIHRAARAGVMVATNPPTNLMLQGRGDFEPRRRGIPRIKQLIGGGRRGRRRAGLRRRRLLSLRQRGPAPGRADHRPRRPARHARRDRRRAADGHRGRRPAAAPARLRAASRAPAPTSSCSTPRPRATRCASRRRAAGSCAAAAWSPRPCASSGWCDDRHADAHPRDGLGAGDRARDGRRHGGRDRHRRRRLAPARLLPLRRPRRAADRDGPAPRRGERLRRRGRGLADDAAGRRARAPAARLVRLHADDRVRRARARGDRRRRRQRVAPADGGAARGAAAVASSAWSWRPAGRSDEAADWAWSRIQPTTWQHLVGERGWSAEQYTERTVARCSPSSSPRHPSYLGPGGPTPDRARARARSLRRGPLRRRARAGRAAHARR